MSPIIGGQTVKGPAAKMYAELGFEPSALAVARHYSPLLTGFLMDRQDADQAAQVEAAGMRVCLTDALMKDRQDRGRLARELVDFGGNWMP